MVNWEFIVFLGVIFISFLLMIRFRDKIKLEVILGIPLKKPIHIFGRTLYKIPIFYAVLLKTKIGIGFTDKVVNRFRRTSRFTGYACIIIAVLSAAFMLFSLGHFIISELRTPTATQAVALVLPFKIKGAIYVPLMYWIISVFVIATVHEFGHALTARAHGIRVKNTGPAFFGLLLPVIPAAYVEPDDDDLKTRAKNQKLAVYSAGAAFNIIFGLAILMLLVTMTPFVNKIIEHDGVMVNSVESTLLGDMGLHEGQVINYLRAGDYGYKISSMEDLAERMKLREPGQEVEIGTTDNKFYTTQLEAHPDDPSRGILGLSLTAHERFTDTAISTYGRGILESVKWIRGLFVYLAILNLGIGMFNLLPMVPLDGGLMVRAVVYGSRIEKPVTLGISAVVLLMIVMLFFI